MPATTARKELVSQDFRYAVKSDSAVLVSHLRARELNMDSALASLSGAQAVADQAFEFYAAGKDRFQVELGAQQFTYHPGMTLRFKSVKLAIDKPMMVIGVQEDADSRKVTLDLFG